MKNYEDEYSFDEYEDYQRFDSSVGEQENTERDTFYALTDGMYGDYEDWKESGGDYGSLCDMIGLD